jgi:Peptidase family M28
LKRIKTIVSQNEKASWHTTKETAQAFIFDDDVTNLTFSSPGSTSAASGVSVYFEGTNLIVYVRGTEDDESKWWNDPKGKPTSKRGVLVNAHYDSVSTGFGATDDGVGVVSILQLLKYYTTPGNAPKHGLVLLLNNGEEDFLNGARVFSQHPMAQAVGTFLNLEGAGAGGKAVLFRSTDTEVTRSYARSQYPTGTVITADGFERGLIRSQTDYVIFNGVMGMRGLDVAFMAPRARYHTNQDDARHTGRNSLWHMLSAALATTQELTSSGMTDDQKATDGVWFDLFGRVFAIFQLHTLFALSVTALTAFPVALIAILAILHQQDKLYLFSGSKRAHTNEGDVPIRLDGFRGFFRFPLIFLFACAAPVALAYLLFKQNEFIAHSSEWAVWSMMSSSFLFVAWFCSRVADFARPSALTRAYGYSWMFAFWWVFLVIGTVCETQYQLAGGYLVLFYFTTVFLVTFLSYLELLSLPTKKDYTCCKPFDPHSRDGSRTRSAREVHDDAVAEAEEEAEPTESSALLGDRGRSPYRDYREQHEQQNQPDHEGSQAQEQAWSKSMWSFTWLVQFFVLAPIIIILGQVALLIVAALHQTGSDGSSLFIVYLAVAIFSIMILSPVVPIIHRFSWHVPMFLLVVLVGAILYNLIAFPFSANNRLKVFFLQEVDLDYGNNTVSLVGASPFTRITAGSLPSTYEQKIQCSLADPPNMHSRREKCTWPGIAAHVTTNKTTKLVDFSTTQIGSQTANFQVLGVETRACKIQFDNPISSFEVDGAAHADKRMPPVPHAGSREIRLWSRTWDRTWSVNVTWEDDNQAKGQKGRVVCMWSDINHDGTIPAYDEALHFAPNWVAMTKQADGLVEGYKRFTV